MTSNYTKAAAWVGCIIAILVGAMVLLSNHAAAPVLGDATVSAFPTWYPNCIGNGVGTEVYSCWSAGKIGPGSNIGYFKNPTSRRIYITNVQANTIANAAGINTASTTYRIFAASSTISTNFNTTASVDFGAPARTYWGIDGGIIATSSGPLSISATSTSGTTSSGNVGTWLEPGQYLIIALQQQYTTPCTGSQCETATSTNRGFDLEWFVEWQYI